MASISDATTETMILVNLLHFAMLSWKLLKLFIEVILLIGFLGSKMIYIAPYLYVLSSLDTTFCRK